MTSTFESSLYYYSDTTANTAESTTTMSNFGATMLIAVQSIGTTATLASAGFYMHRRGFIFNLSKKSMALLSQQVTIPALLLTNLVKCESDPVDPNKCFSVTDSFTEGLWILLIWPLYVISCGATIGWILALLSGTQKYQKRRRAVVAATAFGNSSGLPLTLLVAIQANLPEDSHLIQTDPTVLISCYMIMFPILQWGIGGFLFPREGQDDKENEVPSSAESQSQLPAAADRDVEVASTPTPPSSSVPVEPDNGQILNTIAEGISRFFQPPVIGALTGLFISAIPQLRGLFVSLTPTDPSAAAAPLEWLYNGLFTIGLAAVPVNMVILGINLSMALGDNWKPSKNMIWCRRKSKTQPAPSSSEDDDDTKKNRLPLGTIMAVIVGKLVIMPAVGIASVVGLQYILNVPEDLAGALYLVLMLVFITPTANNLMVLVELSAGTRVKQDMAQLIAWQYLFAPMLLSLSVAAVVLVA